MKIYMVPNTQKTSGAPVFRAAGQILRGAGVDLIIDETAAAMGEGLDAQLLSATQAYQDCDLVLTIGGDGTMLHAARHTLHTQKPLLGVNVGRLGFLTIVESDELEKLRRLPAGDYTVEHRSLLCGHSGGAEPCYALNDLVLFKEVPEHTISLNIYSDEILVSRFRGDGVIFATPTGSTAYSMSAGGPILDAGLEGFVVTQICAHIVQTPPLVFSAGRQVRAVNRGSDEERVIISCDGIRAHALEPGGEVIITQSDKTVPLVQFNPSQQLESIDKKLKGR